MVLAAAGALTSVLVGASVAFASFPGRNGGIAFDATRCESEWVHSIRADGSGLRALTRDPCDDERYGAFEPTWAPDGRLFFWSYDFGSPRFVRAGTRRAAVRFRKPLQVGQVSFSPGGRYVVFVRSYENRPLGRDREIWRARADGSNERRLGLGDAPRWSPGGGTIAYIPPPGKPEGNPGGAIWLMNARTGRPIRSVVRMTTDPELAGRPDFYGWLDWSPNGRRLVYTPDDRAEDNDVWIVRRDGRVPPRRLTSVPNARQTEVVWSPDGRRIAVVSERRDLENMSATHIISVMDHDGGRMKRIWSATYGPGDDDVSPPSIAWQPLPQSRRR